MKKILYKLFILLGMSITLIACSNNNDTQQESMDDVPKNDRAQQETTEDVSQGDPTEDGSSLIQFPEDYKEGVLYTTVTRGNAYEELFTSREAIEAVQNGEPIPSGTVITLDIYEDGELDRIFVMEKRSDLDPELLDEQHNGEWAFQSFAPNGTVNEEEDLGRCMSCHANQERDNFLYKLEEMENYDLEELAGLTEKTTESPISGVSTDEWEIREVAAHLDKSTSNVERSNENIELEGQEKVEIIQNTLLTIFLKQLEN
ncbi:cytochrome P460 family protein [Rossellomorea vietnamensis]|uniref:cytochrome P460 family protein n=1 Tax=Rossellomorea vietnamensis TaxID=218284 RepID=UPI0016536409|nr:cytochrome P460 family protein [Rossellomorea vietnamensis]